MRIVKKSIDARKKQEISYVYTVDVKVKQNETKVIAHTKGQSATIAVDHPYRFPEKGSEPLAKRPVVIGLGPAGLFAAYALARHGYSPLVFERGQCVEERTKDVLRFWESGVLDTGSNVQFGEGGAGAFSDGKLNTLVKDPLGRNRRVLELFVEAGAPSEILYDGKPHIGTDVLVSVVANLRKEIIRLGGEIHFESEVTDFETADGKIVSVTVNGVERYPADAVIFAIGHSARDTFALLEQKQLVMEAKAFAVGFRVEHPQSMINHAQYGDADMRYLPTAPYKLTAQTPVGRGVYSFCMCPGGYVVNASSEEGKLAVNGMSYHSRNGDNANSAIVVTVTPEDFPGDDVLAGVEFQRKLEAAAYEAGDGKIPVQLYHDFCKKQVSESLGETTPSMKGAWTFGNVRDCFPKEIGDSIEQSIKVFGRKIRGFDRGDAILSAVESRTSSPVRIEREKETLESSISGIYPCGEGAGYAGGITSAAMDGLKVAEAILKKFKIK